MVVYSATLGLACIQARGPLSDRWGRLGEPLAWLLIGAALCDAVENMALIRLVSGATGPEAFVAFAFASVKFAIIAAGMAYVAAGAVAYLWR